MYLIFFIVWIIFNGCITPEVILFGIIIAALMFLFICRFMDYSFKKEWKLIQLTPLLLQYFCILLWEIIKANIATAFFVLNQKVEVEPKLIHFSVTLQSDMARVILANSITLTPGTITVDLEGDTYTIHCLDDELATDIDDSVFVKKLRRIDQIIVQ